MTDEDKFLYYLEGDKRNNPIIMEYKLTNLKLTEDFEEPVLELKAEQPKITVAPFKLSGLALKFSRLKTDNDILQFANVYGSLGITLKKDTPRALGDVQLSDFEYGQRIYEPLRFWRWQIDHVKRLIKLYAALKNNLDILDFLYLKPHVQTGNLVPVPIPSTAGAAISKTRPIRPQYEVLWEDGKHASYQLDDDTDMRLTAAVILLMDVREMLQKGVIVDYSTVARDPTAPFGVKFVDRKATKYLLTAIYYDLWRMTNNLGDPVNLCPVCQRPFTAKRNDAVYCSDACRKKKSRQN